MGPDKTTRLRYFLALLCTLPCLFFLGLCVKKYLDREIGTRTKFISGGGSGYNFPGFTVCMRRGYDFEKAVLNTC